MSAESDPDTAAESYAGGDEVAVDSVDDETQLQPQDTLLDADPATGVDDVLDRGYAAPEKWSPAQGYGNTPWEQAHERPLDNRLAEEEPDPALAPDPADDDGLPHEADATGTEVGGRRAGRLVAEADVHEQDVLAQDVGVDGAAASAEEAAVHVIEDDDPTP